MPESLPHVPITQIPTPSSSNLQDPNNTFPLLDPIITTDSVGPAAANEQPKALDVRTETLRAEINKLIDVVNAMSLNFLHRDGTAKLSGTAPDPSFMRGDLDMTDPSGPTAFQVKNTADATQDTDAVTKQQLDALQTLVGNLNNSIGTDFIRRDGTLAATGNLNLGGFQIENLASAINPADAVNKGDFDTAVTALQTDYVRRDGSQSMQGDLNMDGNKITGLPTVGYPTLDGDAVPKKFVDDAFAAIAAVPSGTTAPFAGATVPTGWVICDGRTLTTTAFTALFNAIGYTYGGSGASFNVPDLRGRASIGMDDYGGAVSSAGPANRITDAQADVLGGVFGAETHTLIESELPAHSHSFDDGYFATGSGGALTGETTAGTTTANTLATRSTTTATAGSGGAHNNVQPSMAMLYIIKT